MSTYKETLETCISAYGDNWKAYYAAAECVFIQEHRELPFWTCFIERFEVINDSFIFIHKDQSKVEA